MSLVNSFADTIISGEPEALDRSVTPGSGLPLKSPVGTINPDNFYRAVLATALPGAFLPAYC